VCACACVLWMLAHRMIVLQRLARVHAVPHADEEMGMHKHACTCLWGHVLRRVTRMLTCVPSDAAGFSRMHACTHARTHARTHAYTHARTHARFLAPLAHPRPRASCAGLECDTDGRTTSAGKRAHLAHGQALDREGRGWSGSNRLHGWMQHVGRPGFGRGRGPWLSE